MAATKGATSAKVFDSPLAPFEADKGALLIRYWSAAMRQRKPIAEDSTILLRFPEGWNFERYVAFRRDLLDVVRKHGLDVNGVGNEERFSEMAGMSVEAVEELKRMGSAE